jgi:hypothetical protein
MCDGKGEKTWCDGDMRYILGEIGCVRSDPSEMTPPPDYCGDSTRTMTQQWGPPNKSKTAVAASLHCPAPNIKLVFFALST